jgi:hypothetical protein
VFRHPVFRRYAPLGFCHYGGMIAIQSLWAGPWLVDVSGASAIESARGLFGLNVGMLLAFLAWGGLVPRLHARGWDTARLIAVGTPLSLLMLAMALVLGPAAGAAVWAGFCVSSTVVSLSLAAVGMAYRQDLAGRALSAYNLLIFAGVFAAQWGLGLTIDGLRSAGWSTVSAYRGAFTGFGLCCLTAYLWFLSHGGRSPETVPRIAP